MTEALFLGTGNFLAPEGRYWNSFVLDGTVLVEPCPTALPHLRLAGLRALDLDAIVISHFHPDHTFGWPFLLLELVEWTLQHEPRPQYIIGPPGVENFLLEMCELGSIPNVIEIAQQALDLRYLEVDGGWQEAGPLRFKAVEVDHVPYLRCYGYLIERDGRLIGYSGDTQPCAGLSELAAEADVLILECNGAHAPGAPISHMSEDTVRTLRSEHPDTPFVLTHMGAALDLEGIDNLTVPNDFERLTI